MTSRFHPARVIGSSLRLRMRKYYYTPCGLQPQGVQRKRMPGRSALLLFSNGADVETLAAQACITQRRSTIFIPGQGIRYYTDGHVIYYDGYTYGYWTGQATATHSGRQFMISKNGISPSPSSGKSWGFSVRPVKE